MADDAVRDAFEAREGGSGWARDHSGDYVDCYRQDRWLTWLAAHEHARAQMEASVVVPREPTLTMLHAVLAANRELDEPLIPIAFEYSVAEWVWRVMLATLAEPQPTGAEP